MRIPRGVRAAARLSSWSQVLGASRGWLEGLAGPRCSRRLLEIAGALVLILSGFYILNAHFHFVAQLA